MAEEVIAVLKQLEVIGKERYGGAMGEIYGGNVNTEDILKAMRFVAMEEEAEKFIEGFGENFRHIHVSLLTICFACYKRYKETNEASELRKSRLSLRFLVNIVQRSQKFASSIPIDSMDLLESLLVLREFDKEVLILLTKTASSSFLEFQKSSRYTDLLGRVVDAFYRANEKLGENEVNVENDASSALAYFSILLEKDYALLANCYAEMKPMGFARLLAIVELLLEHTKAKIHVNNLSFVLNLLELMCTDYVAYLEAQAKRNPKSVEDRKKSTVETLKLLTGIVGEMCSYSEMTSYLNENATAINCVVDVLDTILHTEARFDEFRKEMGHDWPELPPDEPKFASIRKAIKEEKRIESARRKQPDRPQQTPISKILRIDQSQSLSALSDVFLHSYKTINEEYSEMGELKTNCLRSIAHLCELSIENKVSTTKNGRMALLSVLQCTRRRPLWFLESYSIQKWAIFCVRQLTDNCQENKNVILNLEQPSQPIIDRVKLLKEFGLKLVPGEQNESKLVRIEEEDGCEQDY